MKLKTTVNQRRPAKKSRAPARSKNSPKADGKVRRGAKWRLRLYVAGQTPKSLAAFSNLKKLCDHHLANRYVIEVVDLTTQPQLAQHDQIVALPTLVRKLPEPMKRVIGDLSNFERVLVAIDLQPGRDA